MQECYDLTESLLERDPYALECLPAHLASAVTLRKKNELFLRGHMCVHFAMAGLISTSIRARVTTSCHIVTALARLAFGSTPQRWIVLLSQ